MSINQQFDPNQEGVGGFCDSTQHESEDCYRDIVEAQTELICRFLPDRTLTFVNVAFCRYFGKQRHELIGENFLHLIPEAERESAQAYWRSLSQENPIGTYEHSVIAPQGEIRAHQWTNRAIFDQQGCIVEFQSVGRASTKSQQAEEMLVKEQEFISTLIKYLPIGIISTDESGEILFVNPSFERICGYSSEELIGQTPPYPYWAPDDIEKIYSEFQQVMSGKQNHTELWFTRKTGERFLGSLYPMTLFDENGNFLSHLATLEDITKRKQAEAEILSLNAELERRVLERTGELRRTNEELKQEIRERQRAEVQILTLNAELEQRVLQRTEALRLANEELKQEIQERQQAEAALRDSEKRFRNLVESTSDWVWEIDKNGVYTYVSPKVYDTLGYAVSELQGKTIFDFMPPREAYRIANLFDQIIAVQESFACLENTSLHKDGHLVVMETSGVIVCDSAGQLSGYRGISRDITERKRAEEALRLQVEREGLMGAIAHRIRQSLNLNEILYTTVAEVRQLLQNDRVLLFKLCDDGVGRVVVESVAPGLPETVGQEFPDEVFPKQCHQYYLRGQARVVSDITHDEFAPCLTDYLQQLQVKSKLVIPILRSSQSVELTDRCLLYPESSLWGVMTAHDCSGFRQWQQWEIDLLSSLATQIGIAIQQSELYLQLEAQLTELQQAEIALQRAKEAAEVANRAKSEFLANMSHELRTPLNGILGYAQILKKDTNLTGQQQDSLSIIYQCGEHLLTLINDILDLSKIEAQRMELLPTEFHLPNLLRSLTDFFRMRSEQKDIAFTYEILAPLPNGVMADQKRLRQVLINLLSNAVKFTDRGGVTFKVGYMGNEPQPTNNQQLTTNNKIRFQVEDTGIGIESSKLEEIFLPFHQVGDRTHAVEGSGLGLAISQKLVQMMGSKIQVRSTLGEGSVFWFDLDLPQVLGWHEPLQSESRCLIGFKGRKRKVLIVDDHQVNLSLLREQLELLEFEILEAVDGQDCLNKAVEFQPDLILMDLVMPVLDGFEATRRLRQLPELKNVVVIALSANVFEATKQESLAAGCQDFLPKPVQTKQLLESVMVHLGLDGIYEEPQSPTDVKPNLLRSDLIAPPPSEIAALSKLVKMGDIKSILDQAARLEKLNSNLVPFATQIRQLAQGFKLKQLLEILQHYLENH